MPTSQARQMTVPAGPLLEREAETAALAAMLTAARDGDGRLVALEGSAGIGKTRLLAEARAAASAAGMDVLAARAGELEQAFAFGVVRQLFEPVVATSSAEERAELLSGAAALAAPLFEESDLLAGSDGRADPSFPMLHGLYWLAAGMAMRRPLLLVVDDLHWADVMTLRWLTYLARRLDGLPLLLVVGTRPPQQTEHSALLIELLTDPAAVVLDLGPLGRESVTILGREVFSAEPDEEFSAACLDATSGNPLYLRALMSTLAAEGVAPTAESATRVHEVGPEPVARAVSLRLSRLSAEAEALARAIAILGQSATLELAAAIAGLERADAHAAATALARSELVRLEPALEFTHPVVRAAVYEAIGPVERLDAHRRAARTLAEAGAEPEQCASHLLLVPPASDAAAEAILRDAARRALARGATEAAVNFLRRALSEQPAAEERAEVLWELGVAERGVDLAAALEHLGEAVALTDDPSRHAEIALDYGRAQGYAKLDLPQTIFREAIERLGSGSPELRELLEAEFINDGLVGDPEQYQTAKELLLRIDDRSLAGGLSSDLTLAALAHFEARRGLDRARTITLAERSLASGLLERTVGNALFYSPDALGLAGDVGGAAAVYHRTIAHARRGGDLLVLAGLLGFRGMLATGQGDLSSAEQDLREGLELARHGSQGNVMFLASWLTEFLLEQGALEEADSTLAALGLPEQVPVSMHFIFFLAARGRLRLEQRSAEKALDDFLTIGRIAETVEIQNPAFRPWRSYAAAALHALGRDEDARELASEELALSRRWGAPRTVGISLRALALVAPPSEREQRLREAVGVLADSPARLEHARALIDLGAALRRANSRREARERLRAGIELAHRCGARALVELANDELAASGAHRRTVLYTGLEALTASERRVALLASEGASNKEIAQALFVTVKTVEMHLSRVYRKLEISSRAQLARALAQPGPEVAAATP